MSESESKDDDDSLKKLGYEQVLHRGLSAFSNFAFGFTEVAVLASFTSQYGFGLATGGMITEYIDVGMHFDFSLTYVQVQQLSFGDLWSSLQ
jgi:hypothetical protein